MKLSEYAKRNSISYQTAWNHFNKGMIEGTHQLPTGTVVIPEKSHSEEKTVVYVRVSPSQNKDNLKNQADGVCNFCHARGWKVDKVVK